MFIEDLHVGRYDTFFDGGVPGKNGSIVLDAISDWLHQLVEQSMSGVPKVLERKYQFDLPASLSRIDCIRDMCALSKRV